MADASSTSDSPPAARTPERAELRAAIAGTARKMSVAALARRGVERAFVLDMAMVERIVAAAVERALARREAVPEPARAAIRAEARGEVLSLVEHATRAPEAAAATRTVHEPPREGAGEPSARLAAERDLQALVDAQLASEREERARLERRIEKQRAALEEAEAELARLREALGEDPGLPSVYRKVQGLAADAPQASRKRELLALVFHENLAIQRKAG